MSDLKQKYSQVKPNFPLAWKLTLTLSIIFAFLPHYYKSSIFISLNFILIVWLYIQDATDYNERYVNNIKLLVTIVNFISILSSFVADGDHVLATEILIFVTFYAVVAISLNLSTGLVGVLNFGVIAQVMVGSVIFALTAVNGIKVKLKLFSLFNYSKHFDVPIWFSIILAVIGAALFSGILALTTLRLRDDYFAIISITIGEILKQFLKTEPTLRGPHIIDPVAGKKDHPTTPGILNIPIPFKDEYQEFINGTFLEDFTVRLLIAIIGILFLILAILIAETLVYSPFGRVLRTIREDEMVSSTYGKDIFRFKVQTFMISGAIAGLAGCLWAWIFLSLFPESFEPLFTFFIWIVFIIGGRGNNKGMIIGAMAFVLVERTSRKYDDPDQFLIKSIKWVVENISPLNYTFTGSTEGVPYINRTHWTLSPSWDLVVMSSFQLILVGLALILFVIYAPRGILPEEAYRPKIRGLKLPPPGSQSEEKELNNSEVD
jgi:ABC-type branched-subunit amino acid transport system permease subunit